MFKLDNNNNESTKKENKSIITMIFAEQAKRDGTLGSVAERSTAALCAAASIAARNKYLFDL